MAGSEQPIAERQVLEGPVTGTSRLLSIAESVRELLLRPQHQGARQLWDGGANSEQQVSEHRISALLAHLSRAAERREAEPPRAADIFASWCDIAPWDGVHPDAQPELERLESVLGRAWPVTVAAYRMRLAEAPTRLHAMRSISMQFEVPEVAPATAAEPAVVREAARWAFQSGAQLAADVAFPKMRVRPGVPPLDSPAALGRLQKRYAADRVVWSRTSDAAWPATAPLPELLDVWRSAVPRLGVTEEWAGRGAEARRSFGIVMRELRRRHPEALAGHDALRRQGYSFAGAMENAAELFGSRPPPPAPRPPTPAWPPRRHATGQPPLRFSARPATPAAPS